MTPKRPEIVIRESASGGWLWLVFSANGQPACCGTQAYSNSRHARRGVNAFLRAIAPLVAEVLEQEAKR